MSQVRVAAEDLTQREQRRLQRRELILQVAERSFLENGYHGTTMSSVATELKGSKETLWRHFSSKEQLFAAFLERATLTHYDELATIFNPSVASANVIELVCTSFLHRVLSPNMLALYRLVVGESGRHPEVGRIFYERVQGRMESLMKNLLQERFDIDADVAEDGMQFLLQHCIGSLFARALVNTELLDSSSVAHESKKISDYFISIFKLPQS